MKGIVPHCLCPWEEKCPIVGVCGRKCAPLLVSVGGIVPYSWCP
ncbi:unnamed protein product [Staurois parvus]|uniref:Uncharacterized protein n=1 Tax=Staurois parvus TaxID=386267 RepID=A0ABN9E822_9NEOB|nr:unnamed protein product [Staurois parvus]